MSRPSALTQSTRAWHVRAPVSLSGTEAVGMFSAHVVMIPLSCLQCHAQSKTQ